MPTTEVFGWNAVGILPFFLSFFLLFISQMKTKNCRWKSKTFCKNLSLLWYRWILVMLLLWLLAWHLIEKRNWVIKDSLCPGSATEVVTKWRAGTKRSIGQGQKAGERNRLHKAQFWPTQTALEPHQTFASWNCHFHLAHWQLFLLCCDSPTAPPQILSFSEWGRSIISKGSLPSFQKLSALLFALSIFQAAIWRSTNAEQRCKPPD